MIIRDKDTDHLQVEMFHLVNISKINARNNFVTYLNQLLAEFDKEHTRHVYQSLQPGYNPVRNDGSSHIIMPDDHPV